MASVAKVLPESGLVDGTSRTLISSGYSAENVSRLYGYAIISSFPAIFVAVGLSSLKLVDLSSSVPRYNPWTLSLVSQAVHERL